jgi:hypothetical protein
MKGRETGDTGIRSRLLDALHFVKTVGTPLLDGLRRVGIL